MTFNRKPLSDLDAKKIKQSSIEKQIEYKELSELGKRFEIDKDRVEQKLLEVQEASLDKNDKEEIIAGLEYALEEIKEQYDIKVTDENRKIINYFQSEISTLQDKIDRVKALLFDVSNIKMEATTIENDKMKTPIIEKKNEFENIQLKSKEVLEKMIKESKEQRNVIFKKKTF